MRNKKLFTLIEMLVVSVIISIVFILIISFYFRGLDIKVQALARQDLMKGSYFLLEKLNILMKDYKIDYEEYFNRRVV
jgi:prepilin-type N-terminal cleavage/methylation domain-containing protein